MRNFENNLDTQKAKFHVNVVNMPPELDISPKVATSELKSLNFKNSNFNKNTGRLSSTAYESVLK